MHFFSPSLKHPPLTICHNTNDHVVSPSSQPQTHPELGTGAAKMMLRPRLCPQRTHAQGDSNTQRQGSQGRTLPSHEALQVGIESP